jgi:TolA-binding protein
MIKKIQDNLTNIVVILGLIASIGAGFTKFAKMESTIEQLSNATAPDLSGIETNGYAIIDQDKEIAIMQKEIEVLKLEILEIKENNKNPLQ